MSRFFHNAVRSFTSLFGFVLDLMDDGLRFLCLTVRSHSALSAEILFLRKQLAFYEERETQPRRLNNSARLSLVLWSRRGCSPSRNVALGREEPPSDTSFTLGRRMDSPACLRA